MRYFFPKEIQKNLIRPQFELGYKKIGYKILSNKNAIIVWQTIVTYIPKVHLKPGQTAEAIEI